MWARCNHDGKPLHSDDKATIEMFKKWLCMTKEERETAQQEPEWREFLGLPPKE